MTTLERLDRERLEANARTPDNDHTPMVRLADAATGETWLLTLIASTRPAIGWGLIESRGQPPRMGPADLSRISTGGRGGGPEHDHAFTATHPISVYARAAAAAGRIVTDRERLDAAAATRPEPKRTFYLAGNVHRRTELRRVMDAIATGTGRRCTARWLHHDLDAEGVGGEGQACFDLADAREADAVVIAHGESSAGGTYVEMGIGLCAGSEVVVWRNAWGTDTPLPVFAHLATVVDSVSAVIDALGRREART